MIFHMDNFHAHNKKAHNTCASSFQPEFWTQERKAQAWACRASYNTLTAEQFNFKLR